MTFRFIHTSDWQIGKVFRYVGNDVMGLLQEARLRAITRIGTLAGEHGARHVLVAGDVYDLQALSPRSLNQPLERMRAFPAITWHLLPGNHDPHRPNGLWDRVVAGGTPANVQVHLAPGPVMLDSGAAVLLPAPLHHRRTLDDPTAFMDAAGLAGGGPRIGLAHGSVRGFGAETADVANYIAPDRPRRASLAYLALGDWHGTTRINERCWYSGTPETDAFDVTDGGRALLVEIAGPDDAPAVTPLATGHYRWISLAERVDDRAAIEALEAKLRGLAAEPERVLLHLAVEGALSLEDRRAFEERIVERASAALCFLRVDESRLFPRPTAADLDRIDRGGFVRQAAEALKRKAETGSEAERAIAAEALLRLYLEHMKLQADAR